MHPGFRVTTSHRLEDLLVVLLRRLDEEPAPPLQPETIVVASPGMARWLSLQMARRQGIAASVEFPFPGEWARGLARRLGVDEEREGRLDPFDSRVLALRIHELLPALAEGERVDDLRRYLEGDENGRRRQSLANRLAIHFGEYQLFRPEVLRAWGRGDAAVEGFGHQAWQARLWRELLEGAGSALPLSEVLLRLEEALQSGPPSGASLARSSAFGLTTLPPVMLRILFALGDHAPVHLYFPNPTVEFWADLQPEKVRERRRLREGEVSLGLYADEVNPLLANLGEQGRDFFDLLTRDDPTGDLFEEVGSSLPDATTALGRVQADVVANRHPRQAGVSRLEPGDDSLLLHVCHSPRRELEVLHDALLQAFASDPDLDPSDVLVLVPDVARYGPFVQAVFGARRASGESIPFTLADRSWEETDPVVRGVLGLVELAASRRSALEVLDLLDVEAVASNFGFDAESVERARGWVRDAGIRWGSDPEQRARDWDLPAYEGASWEEGLDRLLLGALVGEADEAVGGVLPMAGVPAASLELVSLLSRFARTVFDVLETLTGDHDLPTWSRRLAAAVDRVFDTEDDRALETRRQLRRVFTSLEQSARELDLRGTWSRAALLSVLRERLEAPPRAGGFLGGAVTFAALRPMRSLPFEVIALLGLDDGLFPRLDRRDSLDLLGVRRQKGDRSPRRDDRYLFLESLLSARRQLHLSCVGRSERDGTERARSVILSELEDVLAETFSNPASDFVVEHRLQGFHPDYFRASRPRHFSFDAEAAEAARQQGDEPRPVAPFVPTEGGALSSSASEEVELSELLAFWRDPGAWYCRRRLGMHLHDEEELEEEETFELQGLTRWAVRRALLDADPAEEGIRPVSRERVRLLFGLPRTAVSDTALEGELEELRPLRRERARSRAAPPLPVEMDVGEHRLHGVLDGRTEEGLLLLQPGKLRLRHRVDALLRLAALAVATGSEASCRLMGAEGVEVYSTEGCEDELREFLVAAVQAWREAHARPLFLHDAVADAALGDLEKHSADPDDPASVLRAMQSSAARDALFDSHSGPALVEREAWRLLLRGRDPVEAFGADLARWLGRVHAPARHWPAREEGAS